MELSRVRSKFNKAIEFFISNSNAQLKSHASYSLQQDSLNSRDLRLLVNCDYNPKLLGKYIIIENQTYIIHNELNEPFSHNQYIYYLLPCNAEVTIKYINTAKNAIGSTLEIETDGNLALIDGQIKSYYSNVFPAYVDSFLQMDRFSNSQPNSSFNVSVFLPIDIPFNQKQNFNIFYLDNKYKISAVLKVLGAYKISMIKDV